MTQRGQVVLFSYAPTALARKLRSRPASTILGFSDLPPVRRATPAYQPSEGLEENIDCLPLNSQEHWLTDVIAYRTVLAHRQWFPLGPFLKPLDTRRANLRIEAMDVDIETATGRLMLNVMFSVPQIEPEMMLETASETAGFGC